MKCPKCGYDDHGTGDMAHVCATTSPDLIRQVEAESVASDPEFIRLSNEARFCPAMHTTSAWSNLAGYIDSIITARVAAAYEAGRLAALRAAPAGQHDFGTASLAHVLKFTPMQAHDTLVYLPSVSGGFDVRGCPDSKGLAKFIAAACNDAATRFRAEGGVTNCFDTIAASQAAPEKVPVLTEHEVGVLGTAASHLACAGEQEASSLVRRLFDSAMTWEEVSQAAPAKAEGWISCAERLPEDRQAVIFVVECISGIFGHLHGRVLGGTYVAGQGFGVPGLSIDASCWQPSPAPPLPPQLRSRHEQRTNARRV